MNDERKTHIRIWAVVAAVIGLAFVAGFLGRPAYRHFKEKRNAIQAQTFFAKGDYRNALLCARLTLLLNSNNIPACRVMASLNDSVHSPATLDWWQRVVELSPAITNKLLLASAGLRYQNPPYPLTTQILNDLSRSADNLPDFHILSAELDLSLHRMAEAEIQFEAASRLAPTNRLFQLNLAVIRLSSTNTSLAQDARAKLKQFSNDPNLVTSALRSLVGDRLLHDDMAGALNYSTQLLASPQINLGDRLQNLGILRRLKSAKFLPQLKSLQHSSTNAAAVAQVASWMTANGFSADTIHWLTNLPPTLQMQSPVRLALVDGFLAQTNWPALRNFTSKGDWGEMDFLRLACLSRAWFELGESVMANGDWDAALAETKEQFGALNALLKLANEWNLDSKSEDLLWRIARKFPQERWASQELERKYFLAGDTLKLNQLFSLMFTSFPADTQIENNLAATSLLLKTNLPSAFKWAQAAAVQNPNDPSYVSTYAYALYLQGRARDGVGALEKLKSGLLEKPATALYYGVLLAALNENEKAGPFLALAEKDDQLLPEEKQLLTRARKSR